MAEVKKAAKNIRQAVILAGGMGLRLRPYTYDNPKAVVPVNGVPFLAYLIDMLKANGITEVVMLLGYMPEKIKEYLGDGSAFGVTVKYSVGTVEDFTGTRVRNAKDLLDERFLLMYCDNYLHLDIAQLARFHESQGLPATMTVYSNEYGFTKNNVLLDDAGYVTKYDKTRTAPGLNAVDVGFFIFEKKLLDVMPRDNFWIDLDLVPNLISKKDIAGFRVDRPYFSLSTPERLAATEELLGPQKVVFLDRDGVINKKMAPGEYVRRPEEFEFLPGAKEAVALLTKSGYRVYVVSNQAGIGRGLMTDNHLFEVHKHMETELAKHGAKISAIYYCPHGWNDNCKCRKPKAGMLYQAALDHRINLAKATLIGDDPRDIEAGETAGCRTILLDEHNDLLKAVKTILS